MINTENFKKVSDFAREYIIKNYKYDCEKFAEIIKRGRMVYVAKKNTQKATYFTVNYIYENKILNFPPPYLEMLGGYNKETNLIKNASDGMSRSLSLHFDMCRLFDVNKNLYQNFTTL